ncbi:MAG TPA: Gfo/Idh/MocA family oxidoreductase [Chitinophagaceae bacterium]|nr:Gfo/Idh/MocA family oxidoreductase [Chitinophagaceae bacterium]
MVRIGVIGKGEQTKSQIENIQHTKDIKLSGLFITDETDIRSDQTNRFYSFKELLSQSDAIYILESCNDAYKYALEGFRNGKHVFLEQISSFSTDEIEILLNSRKEANVKCMIASLELGHPAFLSIRNEIKNPLFIEAKRHLQYEINSEKDIILDIMLKDIAIILNIVKSDIKRISANGIQINSKQTDLANVRLEFANGCVAVLSANKTASSPESMISIYETQKMSLIDFENSTTSIISFSAHGEKEVKQLILPPLTKHPFIYQLENFRDTIAGEADPLLKLRGAYEKIDIAQKILKKINSYKEE